MKSLPSVWVVVPVFNKIELTTRFLDSFQSVTYPNRTIVIVDDGSTDGTSDILASRYPDVRVVAGTGDLWWSGGTNAGVCEALAHSADYVLTINNDTRVEPDFLDRLVETAEKHPGCLVGSRICFLDEPDRIWADGGFMDWKSGLIFQLRHHGERIGPNTGCGDEPIRAEILTGCGTLVPISVYRAVGLYDAKRFPQYHGDSEFVLRARRGGYFAIVEPRAVIYNDVTNTGVVRSLRDVFFSQRSTHYIKPMFWIHWSYCPWQYKVSCFCRQYTSFLSHALVGKLRRMKANRPRLLGWMSVVAGRLRGVR